MLTKKVFIEQIERLLGFYPTWGAKTEDPKVMKMWYDFMNGLNATDFTLEKSVTKHIKEIKYNPTIATLKECGLEGKAKSSDWEDPSMIDFIPEDPNA